MDKPCNKHGSTPDDKKAQYSFLYFENCLKQYRFYNNINSRQYNRQPYLFYTKDG